MATFKYAIKTKNKSNNKYTIRLFVRNNKSASSLSTGIEIPNKTDWNANSQKLVIREKDTYQVKVQKEEDNEALDLFMATAKDAERALKKRGILSELSAAEIIEFIKNYNPSTEINGNGDFVQYWYRIAQNHPKSATKYKYALQFLTNYNITMNGTARIRFCDITSEFVRQALAYLKETPHIPQAAQRQNKILYKNYSAETIRTYTATIKAVLNCAIDDDKVSASVLKPFRKFTIPSGNTPRKKIFALTMEQLRTIRALNLNAQPIGLQMTRDLFLLSFCLQGINLTDIFSLKKKDIRDTELSYTRAKTGKTISVTLFESEIGHIKDIAKPYTTHKGNIWNEEYGNTPFLFAFNQHYMRYDGLKSAVSKYMRRLRKMLNMPDEFTFYTARDSWATIASKDYNLGQEYIDAGLGHSSKSLAANHYISIDIDKIAKVHANMLKRLFE